MHHTVNILRHLVEHNQAFVYCVMFLGLIIEGEFILISSGVFLHLGALDSYYSFLFMFLGVFSKTFLGYAIGLFINKNFYGNKFLDYIAKRILKLMPSFREKPFRSIFISKFIIGFNNIVVIFSGYEKVNFKTYLKAEFLSTIIWAPILVMIGYFFSYTAISASHELWHFSLIVLALVVIFIVFDNLLGQIYQFISEFINSFR